MNTTTTTAAAYYTDAENVWTPNRSRLLERRMAATKAWNMRCALAKARKAAVETGVLDASDPSHVIEDGCRADTYMGGILFVDGTVHLFNRAAQMHSDYAAKVGRPNVDCGCAYGDEGWGFYLNDNLTVLGYRVPEHLLPRLKEVVAELVKTLPGELVENWCCPLCGWDQRGDVCTDCRKTRKDCEWEAERAQQRRCRDCNIHLTTDDSRCWTCFREHTRSGADDFGADVIPPVVRRTQAADFAGAQTQAQKRSAAAKKANASRTPEQRRAAARKAAGTRRRRQMERGF